MLENIKQQERKVCNPATWRKSITKGGWFFFFKVVNR